MLSMPRSHDLALMYFSAKIAFRTLNSVQEWGRPKRRLKPFVVWLLGARSVRARALDYNLRAASDRRAKVSARSTCVCSRSRVTPI